MSFFNCGNALLLGGNGSCRLVSWDRLARVKAFVDLGGSGSGLRLELDELRRNLILNIK